MNCSQKDVIFLAGNLMILYYQLILRSKYQDHKFLGNFLVFPTCYYKKYALGENLLQLRFFNTVQKLQALFHSWWCVFCRRPISLQEKCAHLDDRGFCQQTLQTVILHMFDMECF